MKKVLFILLLFSSLTYGQRIRVGGNTDRQKVTTFTVENDTLKFQIENDELKAVDLSGLAGTILPPTIVTATDGYSFLDADKNSKTFYHDSASDIEVTIPENATEAIATGSIFYFAQEGVGAIKFRPESATVVMDTIKTKLVSNKFTGYVAWQKASTNKWIPAGSYEEWDITVDPYLAGDGTGGAPQAYINATEIVLADGADTSTWGDLSGNGYDFVTWGTAPEFDNSLGFNQVIFDGVDDGLHMASNYAALNWVPSTDDFTIVMHFGPTTLDNFLAYSLHKGASSGAQAWFRSNSSGNNMSLSSGANTTSISGIRPSVDDGYVVIRNTGGTTTIYLNNTSVASTTAGATTQSDPWALGTRSDLAGDSSQTMSLRKVVFYDYAADLTWLGTRYTNRDTE